MATPIADRRSRQRFSASSTERSDIFRNPAMLTAFINQCSHGSSTTALITARELGVLRDSATAFSVDITCSSFVVVTVTGFSFFSNNRFLRSAFFRSASLRFAREKFSSRTQAGIFFMPRVASSVSLIKSPPDADAFVIGNQDLSATNPAPSKLCAGSRPSPGQPFLASYFWRPNLESRCYGSRSQNGLGLKSGTWGFARGLKVSTSKAATEVDRENLCLSGVLRGGRPNRNTLSFKSGHLSTIPDRPRSIVADWH
jgi:hypothetical protein